MKLAGKMALFGIYQEMGLNFICKKTTFLDPRQILMKFKQKWLKEPYFGVLFYENYTKKDKKIYVYRQVLKKGIFLR
jgi:hypothetical protein